ncbi:O-methyltransferase [Auritidibacter sp. NML120636]|uniref:O-methyltransferase n=1 Tax=Auritidibacter sp. NML120636 TaxID=2170743 RepID=UPI000D73E2DC|nr:class I SAM-dependent methyltransferase [Auritidibacter sp. NML120636]PXA81878.1 methyltransferase [Auritidibacter sp. NML120636]
MKALSPHQTDKHASWAFAEARPVEDEVMLTARERSEELGIRAVTEGTASLLTVLAATKAPRTIVELGTGAGVSGLSLMRGAPRGAVLTTLDPDAEAQRSARESFVADGYVPSRTRLITGRGRTVLPRLSTGAYDLVFIDTDPLVLGFHVEQSARLLRPGGLLVINDAFDGDRVPRPAVRDQTTVALRQAGKTLAEQTDVWSHSTVIPTGSGVLIAIRAVATQG